MKKVFISRDLKPDSIFRQILENQGFVVVGESLILFKKIDFIISEKPDWLFFYSKNGFRFFLEKAGFNYFENIKIAAIGAGTAAFLESKSLPCDFIGNGEPKETARQFSKVATRSKVLFPRAKTSRKSVQSLLNDSIEIRDLVVYENVPKKDFELLKNGKFDILVFTSPMNVAAYFENGELIDNQQVVVIGETTFNALKKWKVTNCFIAENPSEKALAEAVLLL